MTKLKKQIKCILKKRIGTLQGFVVFLEMEANFAKLVKKAGNHVKKTRRVTATLEILPCQDLRKLKLDMEPFDEEDKKRVSVFLQ